MADIKTTEDRSKNMSRIHGKDTGPEVWLRKQLFSCGYRYRKNINSLPGHPDLWLAKYNTAVFVHGCFWHRHAGCKLAYNPKSRVNFWTRKFESNCRRDLQVQQELHEKGIRVLIVWECTIRKMKRSNEFRLLILERIRTFLGSDQRILEI